MKKKEWVEVRVEQTPDAFDVLTRGVLYDRLEAAEIMLRFNREDEYDFDYREGPESVRLEGDPWPVVIDPTDIIHLMPNASSTGQEPA